MRTMAAGALLALALAGEANAQIGAYETGNELYTWCTTAASEAHCLSYILGVSDTISSYQGLKLAKTIVCAPKGVTGGQIRDVVVNYLKAHPEERHTSASSSILVALSEVWPCR
jgi:hypothetical protein